MELLEVGSTLVGALGIYRPYRLKLKPFRVHGHMNEVSNQSTLSLLGALPLVARTSLHHFHGRQDELCKSHDQTPIAELGLRSNGSKIGDETAPNDGEDDEQEEATEGCVCLWE